MLNFEVFTKDPDIAKKLLIGSLLILTGIGLFAVLGWMLEIMRQVHAGKEPALPEFENIGGFLVDGLKVSAVAFLWSLPLVLIVTVLAVGVTFAPILFADPNDAAVLISIASLCITGLTFVFIVPLLVLLVPAMGILAETGSIKAALNVRRAIQLVRANPGGFVIAGLLAMLVNSLLGSLGMMLCFIGFYPATVVSYALQGQLFGKAYADASHKLGYMSV